MNQHSKPNTPGLDSYWMPFTANRQFKAAPRLLASAEACTIPASMGAKSSTGRRASGASMPVTAAARSPRRSSVNC
jgi:adenosylmethionine-8-amino-7-oxononanoate aminotransferase